MYRVYDNKEKKWVKETILLSPSNDLILVSKALFGRSKLLLVSEQRYTRQNGIGFDIENKLIFEGDICEASDGIIGLIIYAPEQAAYILLDYQNDKWYPLGDSICKNRNMKVIGNIFDNPDLIPEFREEDNDGGQQPI